MRYLRSVLAVGVLGLVLTAPQAEAESSKLVSMPAFGSVMDFEISPDGVYAVYRGDQDSAGVDELY
ncbi:hypothetical protein LCGC14_2357990, partial [marine sediment metagenome]